MKNDYSTLEGVVLWEKNRAGQEGKECRGKEAGMSDNFT